MLPYLHYPPIEFVSLAALVTLWLVGAVMLTRWGLAPALEYVARFHHDVVWTDGLPLRPDFRDLLAVVALARYLTIDDRTAAEQTQHELLRLRLDLAAPTLVAIEVEARERADELGRALAA